MTSKKIVPYHTHMHISKREKESGQRGKNIAISSETSAAPYAREFPLPFQFSIQFTFDFVIVCFWMFRNIFLPKWPSKGIPFHRKNSRMIRFCEWNFPENMFYYFVFIQLKRRHVSSIQVRNCIMRIDSLVLKALNQIEQQKTATKRKTHQNLTLFRRLWIKIIGNWFNKKKIFTDTVGPFCKFRHHHRGPPTAPMALSGNYILNWLVSLFASTSTCRWQNNIRQF